MKGAYPLSRRHTHITLRVQANLLNGLEALVDEERIPVSVNIGKLAAFLVRGAPQEVRQLCEQQCVVFLEHVGEAGNEASLVREYLSDFVTTDHDPANLPTALSALTGKSFSIQTSLWSTRKWVRELVTALDEAYITKPLVATLVSGKGVPEGDTLYHRYRRYFLLLLK